MDPFQIQRGFLLEEIHFCDKMNSQVLWTITKREHRNKWNMGLKKKWGEVRVTIPKEAQEAFANFLMERGSTGISIEDEGEKEGFEIVKAYFPWPLMIEAQSISRYLEAIREFFPKICPSDIEVRSIAEKDWMTRWRDFFNASQPGRRIVVKPPWISLRPREMIVIDIEPGMAFGTGTHPTTRLCLRALEKALTGVYDLPRRGGRTPRSVLDVGMGSGILAIAAAKLGARHVVGIDVDQRAIDNARENIRINKLRRRIRLRKATISQIGEQFGVVVVNINAQTIKGMRDHLMERVATGGILILSGVLDGEVDLLKKLFPDGFFTLTEVSREDGWACMVLKRA
ncbi:MAG: 50S ribosomal protein L11 methyltransferase [Syntrophobacterales bacterium]|nr:MAG: 50S ribosomal protein L11 methyltransferase [Syntrophobacterales bacterium]